MKARHGNPRNGMALITAVTLLALVSVAVASIGVSFALSAKRTSAGRDDAQLRQLLLAGTTATLDHLNTAPVTQPADRSSHLDMPLPDTISDVHITISFEPSADTAKLTARVEATLAAHHRSQKLHLSHTGGSWRVEQANFD